MIVEILLNSERKFSKFTHVADTALERRVLLQQSGIIRGPQSPLQTLVEPLSLEFAQILARHRFNLFFPEHHIRRNKKALTGFCN